MNHHFLPLADFFHLEHWELLSYIVTVFGFPFAIIVLMLDRRKDRINELAEIYQRLSDEYSNFIRLLIEHPDLHLLRKEGDDAPLTPDQQERKLAIFNILVSLFERAYILVFDEHMDKQTTRLWLSWEDYIRSWCKRRDFREALPELLPGEDEDFIAHIHHILKRDGHSVA